MNEKNSTSSQLGDRMDASLKTSEVVGYGAADAGQAMIGTLIGFYQIYFFTDVLHLPLSSIVGLFILTKILDSVCFPLFGALVDHTSRGNGGLRNWLFWLIIPFFISSCLLFIFNKSWTTDYKIIHTYLVVSLYVMISALLSVVYSGLVSSIANRADDRAKLSTVRFVFAFGASTIASLCIKDFVNFFGGKEGSGFYYIAVTFSALAAVALYITYLTTSERSRNDRSETITIKHVVSLLRNRVFFAPLLATICTGIFVAIKSQSTLYFITYVMGRPDISNYFLAASTVCCALGVAIVGLVINRIDRKRLFTWLMIGNGIFIGSVFFLDANNVTTIIVFSCLNSLLGGACAPVIFSIYSDVVDYFDYSSSYRSPALINSLAMLSGRLGGSIGAVFTPAALAYFHYIPDKIQDASALQGISLMFTIVPASLAMAAGLAMLFYSISNKQAQETSRLLSFSSKPAIM